MATDQDKPLLAYVNGPFQYWLLEPPGLNTPIVKHYTAIVSSNVKLLANYNRTRSIVDEAVCVLQQYNRMVSIPIATQCNRLMKHTEALAVYLAYFQSISAVIVPKLHYSMKCLYYHRPPREIEGKEMLSLIAVATKSVAHATSQSAYYSKKADDAMAEIVKIMKQEDCEEVHPSMEALSQVIKCISAFWQAISVLYNELNSLSCQISSIASHKISIAAEDFEMLKEQVIRFSAMWTAVGKVCSIYFNADELLYDLKHHAHNAVPRLLINPDNFYEFAVSLDNHFQDIYFRLISEDYEMQKEVVIYNTWMHPKVNTSGLQCIQTAQEAMELIQQGKGKEADAILANIKHQSRALLAVTHLIANRLENLEAYAVHQQELLMKEIEKLEIEEKEKSCEINNLDIKIATEKSRISQYMLLHKNAEMRYKDALEKQQAAEKKIKKISKWWRSPQKQQDFNITGFVQSWIKGDIKSNASIATEEAAKIDEYLTKKKQAEKVVIDSKQQKASLENEKIHLRSHIDKFKQQKDERFKMFTEMKQCTAYLKQTIFFWNDFIVAAEHGQTRTEKLEKLVTKANEKVNSAKVLQSRGTKSASKTFIDAWETISDMAQEAHQRDIVYTFKCAICHIEQTGLPMPVDKMDVVCNTCAKIYI